VSSQKPAAKLVSPSRALFAMLLAIALNEANTASAAGLSLETQHRIYKEDRFDKKPPGIYETENSYIVIAEAKCSNGESFKKNQRPRFLARKELMRAISGERQKRLRASIKGLSSLRTELVKRRHKLANTARFDSLSLKSEKRSACRYRQVEAIDKSAFVVAAQTPSPSLTDLEDERIDLFREYLRQGKLGKLTHFYREVGMPELSAVHGLEYLSKAGYPSYNFPAVARNHVVASAKSGEPVKDRKQAIRRIRSMAADCRALLYLAGVAKGVLRRNLQLAAAPACSFEVSVSAWAGRNVEKLESELANWYSTVRPKDARGLLITSMRSHGMLRFADKVSYGDQSVAVVWKDTAFKLFETKVNPRNILLRLTAYLSHHPFDWRAWNKMGEVLRVLNFQQSALSANTQALNTGGVNAVTLAHLSRNYEAAGNRNVKKLKSELANWYSTVRPKDARGLLITSMRSHGILRFDNKVSYGAQSVALVWKEKAFKLFETKVSPRNILLRMTAYLSHLPFDWRAWNKMGEVLSALNFPQSALSAHTQALNTGGVNAMTLAHLSRNHEASGNRKLGQSYAQEVLRRYYPRSNDSWALETAKNIVER